MSPRAVLKLPYLLGIHYNENIVQYVSAYMPVRTYRKHAKKPKVFLRLQKSRCQKEGGEQVRYSIDNMI